MKQNILKYSLVGGTFIMGFLSWFSVQRAIKISDSSTWVVPMICFSLYAIFLCLSAVLVREEIEFELAVFFSMLPSLVFALFFWHFAILVFCALIMLRGLKNIRNDLDLNVKISLWKSLGTGKFKIVLALAILTSSQYFFIIKNVEGQKAIPKFDTTAISAKLVEPILKVINPDFKTLENEGLTVDEFISESQKRNENDPLFNNEEIIDGQIPENMPAKQREALKQQALEQLSDSKVQLSEKKNELALQEGRKQFSQMVGHEIKGDEKIADVFAGLIDKKINDYFQPQANGDSKSSVFIYILVAVLFLTIWPLGSILCSLCFGLVVFAFSLFVHFGIVKIDKVMVEREVIN